MRYWDLGDWIIAIGSTFFVVLIGLVLLVYIPTAIVTEGRCLEGGYPNSAVTWNLKKYCMKMQGTVSVKVDSLDGVVSIE